MKLLSCNKHRWFGFIAGLLLGLIGANTVAETPLSSTTASEIEQALQVPKSRSLGNKSRGLQGIVADPAEYLPTVDTDSYSKLQALPKVSALINFDPASNRIRPDSYSLLNQFVQALNGGLADAVLVVAGHTDSDGAAVYNWNLSRRRAQAVKDYLVSQGIAQSRLIVKAYGETQPITSNATLEGRTQNRRVEFIRVE